MIPYGRQDIQAQDIQSVVDVLKSDFLTQGPVLPAFEKAVARRCGSQHALAVNSATSALHIACLALDLGPGDWLWTSAITFLASANCGRYCGAQVDFVDIEPLTYNLCSQALERKLLEAEPLGRLPKVVVVVHLCGQPCDMQAIHALGQRFGFRIIEDASHAIGARYQGEPVGNSRFSDITVFSFHPVKIITTAEGGMAVTNDASLAQRMDLYRSHGMTRDPALMSHEPDGPWYYQQVTLGFNYRMTEMQAALGLSQLDRLDAYVAQRHALARRYDERLAGLPLRTPWQHPDGHSAFHLYVIRLDLARIGPSHRQVFESLRAQGVGVNLHYIPVPTQPYYQALGCDATGCPESLRYYAEAISLPLHATLSHDDQDQVVAALKTAIGA